MAKATAWQNPGDWKAAWCSLKIILLSVAGLFLVLFVEETLLFLQRTTIANLFLLSVLLPVIGFGIGLYYLLKSLL